MNEEIEPLLFTGLAALIIGIGTVPASYFGWGLILWGALFTFFSLLIEIKA